MEQGTVVADRFEIERRVSAGGMSAVFRAKDRQTGGTVAVKVLYGRDEGEHRERLYREARVLEKLSHPGIVRYVAHGEVEADKPYLAMEWIVGETLGKRLARTGFTMGESVRMITRVAETLAVAHAKGIIHRDIKPGNLILRDGNVDTPTLIDFGIARMGLGASAITNTGVMLGTLGYMAPEQARGTKQLDARADVFALGAVLFKCLTGLPAFAGDDEIAILAKMLFEAPPRVRDIRKDVPKALDDLLARMLSRDPLQRPADAGIAAAELSALGQLEGAGVVQAREASTHGDVITRGEQRLVSVVSVAAQAWVEGEESTIAERRFKNNAALSEILRNAIKPFGAHLESLATGTIVVTLPGRHSATDQAARAARCVLAMRTAAPNVPMVLATGRAVLEERVPTGDAVDRAIRMLEHHATAVAPESAKKQPIHIDEVTAGLLDARFVVKSEGAGLELVEEQPAVDAGRMLLGKPTPTVGRERELVMLEGVFAETVADDVARAVLVTAPAGVGKSRLRYELLRTLQHRGDRHAVWTSRGDPMRAGSPFGMLSQIIRAAADVQDGEPARVQREKIRARVSRSVPQRDLVRVTQFLAETLGVSMPDEDDVQLRAARHDPILMGDQMRRAFEDWLSAECKMQPVLLVLEDLHWGDLPTVKFLDSALRTLHDRPLMVLALARPEVKDLFPDLFAERGVQELRLKELSKKASEKLVRQVLGETTHDEVIGRIVKTAGGNAFFLEELIRSVSLSGQRAAKGTETAPLSLSSSSSAFAPMSPSASSPGSGGASVRRSMLSVDLPETVLTMVQARLEALEPEARRVLRAASVFGQTFWRGGVVALLNGARANDVPAGMRPSAGENEGAQVTAWLDELAVREIVVRREHPKFKSETEFFFRHSFVAEAAYGMLTDKDRVIGHKMAAQWLEKMGESEPVVLAEHLERGGEPKRAITFYRRAAAQALEGNDLEACLARADRGIACGAEGEVLGRLLLRKSEAHRWRGENVKGKECAQRALGLLPRSGRRWFLAAGEAVEACARLGEDGELHRGVDDLCEVSSAGTLSAPHLVALTRAACVLMGAGNYPSADELLRTIDAAYESVRGDQGDPLAAAHVYGTRAYRALVSGDTGSALSMYNVAITHFEAAGDMRAACRHLMSAAAACIELGAYPEAERALNDALASAAHMGLTAIAANVWHHQARLHARLGDLSMALTRAQSAIEAFAAQGDRRMEAAARLYRGSFFALGEDLEAAEIELETVLDQSGATAPLRAYGLAFLASTALKLGKAHVAETAARESLALLESLGGVEEGEALIRLTYAEALDAIGDQEGAREAIATARVRILERTAMIQDAQWKDTFIQRVGENVRTLELARAWRVT